MSAINPSHRALLRDPAGCVALGFGAGLSPWAPGTVGTLAALLPWLALRELPMAAYLIVVVLAFALGVWAAQRVIERLKIEDPGLVVWDEFVGLWITLIAVPDGWLWVALGFVLFRIFDIAKPWPVSWADHQIKGGFGAMFDDALAGLYALALLQALAWWWR